MNDADNVILFDGVCNLCNSSVNFMMDRDRKKIFKFASLQSEFGRNVMERFGEDSSKLDSVVLLSNGKLYTKADAALKIASKLSMPYPLSQVFKIIPKSLRDVVYDYIAANRYKWFGKRDACRIPDADTKNRFLG